MFKKIFAPHPTIYKYDKAWIGLLLGLILPLSGILIVYLLSIGDHYLSDSKPDIIPFTQMLQSLKNLTLLMRCMSLGCILNLAVFYFFVNRDYFNVSRGIIFSTMLVAVPVMGIIVVGWFK